MHAQTLILRNSQLVARRRRAAVAARNAARYSPAPIVRLRFALRCAAALCIGCAAAPGAGSVIGFFLGLSQ